MNRLPSERSPLLDPVQEPAEAPGPAPGMLAAPASPHDSSALTSDHGAPEPHPASPRECGGGADRVPPDPAPAGRRGDGAHLQLHSPRPEGSGPAPGTAEARTAPPLVPKPAAQLLRTKLVFKSPYFPVVLRVLSLILLALGLCALLLGPQDPARNPGHVLMWFLWWPLFVIQYLLLGRFWCAVCPFGWLGDGMRALCGLNLPTPSWLKKYGPLVIGAFLLLIVWAEEALRIPSSPRRTAILLLLVIGCVLAASAVFRRRAWCRYMCPLGGMGVAYARVGMLQIRGNPDKCRTCNAALCYYGAREVDGCPMNEFPRIKETNAYCIFCGNCVKTCPKDSAKVEVRLPSRELWLLRKPGLMEAVLAVLLGGVISATQFQHSFPEVMDLLARPLGLEAGFTFFFLAWQGLFLLFLALASQAATVRNGVSVKTNFTIFSYSLIPLILGAHLAQSLGQLAQGSSVFQRLALERYGLDLPVFDPQSPLLRLFQLLLLTAGLFLCLAAVRSAAKTFFSRQGKVIVSLAPFTAAYTALFCLLAWILSRNPGEALESPAVLAQADLHPLWIFLGFALILAMVALSLRPLLSERPWLPGQAAPPRSLRLTVRNEATEIVTAERALTRLAQSAGTGIKPIFDACTALEEIMTYALLRCLDHMAAQPGPAVPGGLGSLVRLLKSRRPYLDLQFTVLPQAIIIEMAEEGPPDNPLDDGSGATARAGRQIQRLRAYTSSLAYERRDGKNVLTVVQSLDPESRASEASEPLTPTQPPR